MPINNDNKTIQSTLSLLKSKKQFAFSMSICMSKSLKQSQKQMITYLNDYVEGRIDVKQYCRYLKWYQSILLTYRNWLARYQHYCSELKGVIENA